MLAFSTAKANLDATTAAASGIYLRDLQTGVTKLITRNTATGSAANVFNGGNGSSVQDEYRPAFSGDSSRLVYVSRNQADRWF